MIRKLSFLALGLLLLSVGANARAGVLTYTAVLSGPAEFPANASPGTGFTQVTYNTSLHTLRVQTTFSGLTGTTTASHIHAPTTAPLFQTAGVATQTPSFTGFPLGVTSGSMDQTFDLTLASSWNSAFITANGGTPASAEAVFASALTGQKAYLNIHTSTFGGGEIRGFLLGVPEPAALALAGLALVGLVQRTRRR